MGEENRKVLDKGFRFQLSSKEKQQSKYQWGPANPQSLNRYAYTLNNPLRYTDPTGHFLEDIAIGALATALGIAPEVVAPIIALVSVAVISACLLNTDCRNSVVQLAQDFINGVITVGTFIEYAVFDLRVYFGSKGNEAHNGILKDLENAHNDSAYAGKTDKQILQKWYEAARRAKDFVRAEKIRATQKDVGTRRSRQSKDKKK